MMKRTLFTIILTLIFVYNIFLPNTFAQEHIHLNLPEGAKARLGKGSISQIAHSPDGDRLAVASSIGVWMYDTKTGEALDLLAPNTAVESVSFSPDGQILATGNEDGNVRLWHVTTGDLLQTISRFLPLGSYSAGQRKNVVFSPDGNTLAVSNSNNTVFLWNANTRKQLHSFIEYRYKYSNRIVPPMAFSPDGNILAISVGEYVDGDGDGDDVKIYVFLWDVNTGETLQTLIGHANVSSISFSPDGSTLAIGSRDDIRFWDVNTGETLQTLTGHTGTIRSISFSPDGSTLATGSRDEIHFWDVNTGETLKTLTEHTSVSSISFSPDGSTLATGSWDEIHLWDVNTGEVLQELTGHHQLYNVSFSPNGNILVYLIAGENEVQLRDVNTGKLQTFTGTDSIYSVSFSPDGNTLAIRGRNEVQLRDINTGKLQTFTGTRWVFDPHTGVTTGFSSNVFSMAFSPDGNTLAIGGNWIISLLNTNTGETIHNFTDIACRIESVAISPDGNTLAGGGSDSIVRLWDIKTGTQRQIHTGQNGDIKVAFSPDGNTLATVPDIGGQVLLWDVNTGKQLREFTTVGSPRISRIFSMAFSPDGNTLATGSDDYLDLGTRSRWDWTVTLWDVNTGGTLQTLTGHTRTVSSISFSPDGATLATGGGGTVLLWELTPFLPEPKRITADINADGIVNIQDLVLVSSHFGNTGENEADVNGDGEVNIQDLVLVADAIGSSNAAPTLNPQ